MTKKENTNEEDSSENEDSILEISEQQEQEDKNRADSDSEHSEAEAEEEKKEEEETPKKRGRGRPRKEKTEKDKKKEVDPNTPKRGRGRPRKYVDGKKDEKPTPTGPKRGRGRPRKRPLEEVSDSEVTESQKEKEILNSDGTPKRGRGRPRKVQKLNSDSKISEDIKKPSPKAKKPIKKITRSSAGRPAVGNKKKSLSRSAKSKFPQLKRSLIKMSHSDTENEEEENHFEEENEDDEVDTVDLSDSEEEFNLFDQINTDIQTEQIVNFRKSFIRKNRINTNQPLNKILLPEKIIKFKENQKNEDNTKKESENRNNSQESVKNEENVSLNIKRIKKALEVHLGKLNKIRILPNDDENSERLICQACGNEICHKFCPLRFIMHEIKSTFYWFSQIHWNPDKNEKFSLLHHDKIDHLFLSKEEKQNNLILFLNDNKFTSKYAPAPKEASDETLIEASPVSTENPFWENLKNSSKDQEELISIISQFSEYLKYIAQKIRVKQVHLVRFQRALFRFINFDFNNFTYQDSRLIYKLIRAFSETHNKSNEIDEVWKKAVRLQDEKKSNKSTPTKESSEKSKENAEKNSENTEIEKLKEFAKELFSFYEQKNTKFVKNYDYSTEAVLPASKYSNPWGINEEFVEFLSSANPKENNEKLGLLCLIPSRHTPIMIIKNIFKCLRKDYDLTVQEILEQEKENRQIIVQKAFGSNKNSDNISVVCRADNWADYDIHLFIEIHSKSDPIIIGNLIRSEIKKYYRGQDEIDKFVSFLPYETTSTHVTDPHPSNGDSESTIELTVTTGNSPSDLSLYSLPSTLIVGKKNDLVIMKCLMTWCGNDETYTNGPTIQFISVHQDYRHKGYGSALINWIVRLSTPFLFLISSFSFQFVLFLFLFFFNACGTESDTSIYQIPLFCSETNDYIRKINTFQIYGERRRRDGLCTPQM